MKNTTTGQRSIPTNRIAQKIEALRCQHKPLLDLTESNPTRCDFKYQNQALLLPFLKSENLNYEPDSRGLFTCRKTISNYYAEKNIFINPDDILITASTSEAYALVFKFLFPSPGSLLAPEPTYPLLDFLIQEHPIQTLRYPIKSVPPVWQYPKSLDGTCDTSNLRAALFVNPNNPTGNYLSAPEMSFLETLDPDHRLAVICDEVFWDYPLRTQTEAILSLAGNSSRLTFTLSGISKVLGLPQMKLSWMVVSGPEDLKKQALEHLAIDSDHYLSASTPIQNACPEWFRLRTKIQSEIRTRLVANYAFLERHFADFNQVTLTSPGGGWCVPLRLPAVLTDEEWALKLLDDESVLTHPGYLFDFAEESYLVLSLLVPTEIFREGVVRISRCISKII